MRGNLKKKKRISRFSGKMMMCKDNSVYKDRDCFSEILNLMCTLYQSLSNKLPTKQARIITIIIYLTIVLRHDMILFQGGVHHEAGSHEGRRR